ASWHDVQFCSMLASLECHDRHESPFGFLAIGRVTSICVLVCAADSDAGEKEDDAYRKEAASKRAPTKRPATNIHFGREKTLRDDRSLVVFQPYFLLLLSCGSNGLSFDDWAILSLNSIRASQISRILVSSNSGARFLWTLGGEVFFWTGVALEAETVGSTVGSFF